MSFSARLTIPVLKSQKLRINLKVNKLAFADVLLNIGCVPACVEGVCEDVFQTRPEGGQTEPEVKEENRRVVVKDLTGQLMSS